jgi:hypothetical protein
MIENSERIEMRAGASRLVESTCSSDVKSSIAGVVGSPNQLPSTPSPASGSIASKMTGKSSGRSRQCIEI